MSDVSLGSFSFDVSTSGLRAGSDELSRFEARINAATVALDRMEARSAAALIGMSPTMRAMLGPSPAGGSAAGPMAGAMAAAGLSPSQLAGLTASTTALSAALRGPVAPLASFAAAAQAATASLRILAQVQPPRTPAAPPKPPAPYPTPAPASPSSPSPRPSSGGAGGHGTGGGGQGSAASYGNTLQMMELAHVGRALFDEMAAGGNVLRGLAMEFGRLQIAVSAGEGGITGMLGRIAGFAGRLASPLALATTSALALGAASVYGFSRFEAGQDALQVALNGRGRFSGLTLDGASRLAASSSLTGGLSLSEGTSLAAGALGAGLSRDMTGSVIEMSRDLGRITGKGTDEAGKMLAAALAEPMRGLGEFDKLLGGVDDRLKAQIDDAVRSGHLAQAQALELGFVNRALHEAGDSAFSFSRAMSGAGNWISDRFSALGHGVATALGYGSDADNLAKNRSLLATMERAGGSDPAEIAALKGEITRLEAVLGKSAADAARREAEGRAIELSGKAGDAVRQIMPEIMRQRSAADTVDLLRQTLADPLVMQHLDPSISGGMVGRAYSQASVLEAMSRPGLRERQDYDLGLSRIKDVGVQDQGLNVARQAELSVLRETGDVMRAATAAQRAYNLELARAQESADELARSSKQRFDLIGLSPFDKAMKEIDQKYLGPRGLIESYTLDKGGANVMADKDIRSDLSSGFKVLTAAQEVAGGITAAGGHLASAVEAIAAKVESAAGRVGPAEAAARGSAPWAGTLDRSAFGAGSAIAPQFTAGGAFGHAPADIQAQILAASMRTGMSPSIIAAIGERENGFRLTGGTNIKGPDGRPASSAYGFGQLTDGAAADVARALPGFSKFDPSTAVLGSAEYLKILTGRFGDMRTALDHYGTGPGYGSDILRRAGGAPPTAAGGTLALGTIDIATSPLHVAAREAATAPLAYNGGAVAASAYEQDKAGVLKTYTSADPLQRGTALGEATLKLQEQRAALDLQAAMFGKSEAAIKGATAAQGLWASYLDSGVTKTARLSDATGELADRVRLYGSEAERVAQQQEDAAKRQQMMVDAADTLRGGAGSVLSGGLLSAAHGQGFGKGASSALASFGDSLITKGSNSIVSALLGGSGSPLGGAGGGLLGSLFSSLPHFAGGSTDAPGGPTIVGEAGPELVEMPAHAQVMNASATQGLMQSRGGGHTFSFGDRNITVEGNADERTLAAMDAKIAASDQRVIEHITRNYGQIQSDARQY